jgi:hypothetical protein
LTRSAAPTRERNSFEEEEWSGFSHFWGFPHDRAPLEAASGRLIAVELTHGKPGWFGKQETDGAFSMHLCPAHNRKSWDAVRDATFAAGESLRSGG